MNVFRGRVGTLGWERRPRRKNSSQALRGSGYNEWRISLTIFILTGALTLKKTGRRLPTEIRKQQGGKSTWEAQGERFAESFLHWLGAKTESQLIAEMTTRLDAVLRYTSFVVSEFLSGEYSLEKRASDVFDQFQLHYLAIDRFIIVSRDSDLFTRTSKSLQAGRIMPFHTFLRSL